MAALYRSGIRINEALSLYPKDVDFCGGAGAVRVLHRKGDKSCTVGIDPGGVATLMRRLEIRAGLGLNGIDPIFCMTNGEPLDDGCIRMLLPHLGRKAGIAKRVHAPWPTPYHAAESSAEGSGHRRDQQAAGALVDLNHGEVPGPIATWEAMGRREWRFSLMHTTIRQRRILPQRTQHPRRSESRFIAIAAVIGGDMKSCASSAAMSMALATGCGVASVLADDVPGPDCNYNANADAKDIDEGRSTDCDGDGQPDECQGGVAYVNENGNACCLVPDGLPGFNGDVIVLNKFFVRPGGQYVTHMGIAWGGPDTPDGHPITLLIYRDPDHDGDPHDAELVAAVPSQTAWFNSASPLKFTIHPVPLTYVGEAGDVFFAGFAVTAQIGESFALWTHVSAAPTGWTCWASTGQIDLADLSANNDLWPWMLNGIFSIRPLGTDCDGNGVPDQCDISSGASADANGNGIPDECEPSCPADIAPFGGDKTVGIDDLQLVIANWNRSGSNPADLDHSNKVNVDDLFAVINSWGPCP